MFSCVWLHFKKFSEKYFLVFGKEEGKDKPRKTRTKPRKKIINDRRSTGFDGAVLRELLSNDRVIDRDRRRDLMKARSRSTLRDCDRWHDLAKRRSRSREASHRSQSARCFVRSRFRIAVVGLELARSARTGARGSPAIVELDWSSVFFLSRTRSLFLSLFPEIL